jgi:hypothetical protein
MKCQISQVQANEEVVRLGGQAALVREHFTECTQEAVVRFVDEALEGEPGFNLCPACAKYARWYYGPVFGPGQFALVYDLKGANHG